jgi:4-oxalocrotonate tautomerase
MPLVRIDHLKGKPEGFGKKAGEIVYRTMVEVLSVPARDQFQVSSEQTRDDLIYDPTYLDIPRGDGILIIQITLNDGRTVEMKKAFYKALAERLNKELGVRKEDVFVNLVEVKKENWSFGSGVAQYAE